MEFLEIQYGSCLDKISSTAHEILLIMFDYEFLQNESTLEA